MTKKIFEKHNLCYTSNDKISDRIDKKVLFP